MCPVLEYPYNMNTHASSSSGRPFSCLESIIDSEDYYSDENNPLFGRINGATRSGIALHVTPTKNSSNERDGTETQ